MLRQAQHDILPILFIGRFQPFHLGHLDALQQISKKETRIIIAIGSAENKRSKTNPFTARQRYQMIEQALREKLKNIIIIPVRDINNNNKWVRHIESLLPEFGNVYTGSSIVKRLFEKAGRHKVIPIHIRKKISGTEIRKRISEGKKWSHLVPKGVAMIIKFYGH